MSASIFMDLENQLERSVFVDVRNTSDKDIDVAGFIRQQIEARGYTIAENPRDAFYILQANVLYVGQADPSAIQQSLLAGYGGALGGGVVGGMLGAASSFKGAAIGTGVGALVGGVTEVVAGSLVKDVTYTIVTDLQIAEKTPEEVAQTVQSSLKQGTGTQVMQKSQSVRERRKYQTRVVSSANQVNLEWQEAEGPLLSGLAKSIAGIF